MYNSSGHHTHGRKNWTVRLVVIAVIVCVVFFAYSQHSKHQSEVAQHDASISSCNQKREALSAQIQVMYEHKTRFEKMLKDERDQRTDSEKKCSATLEKTKTELNKEKDEFKAQANKAADDKKLADTMLTEANEKVATLTADLDQVKKANEDGEISVKERMGKLDDSVKQLEDKVSQKDLELKSLQDDNDKLKDDAKNYASEIAKLKASISSNARVVRADDDTFTLTTVVGSDKLNKQNVDDDTVPSSNDSTISSTNTTTTSDIDITINNSKPKMNPLVQFALNSSKTDVPNVPSNNISESNPAHPSDANNLPSQTTGKEEKKPMVVPDRYKVGGVGANDAKNITRRKNFIPPYRQAGNVNDDKEKHGETETVAAGLSDEGAGAQPPQIHAPQPDGGVGIVPNRDEESVQAEQVALPKLNEKSDLNKAEPLQKLANVDSQMAHPKPDDNKAAETGEKIVEDVVESPNNDNTEDRALENEEREQDKDDAKEAAKKRFDYHRDNSTSFCITTGGSKPIIDSGLMANSTADSGSSLDVLSAVASSQPLLGGGLVMSSAEEIARNLMIASEISASRILQKVSEDAAAANTRVTGSNGGSLLSTGVAACSLHPDGKTNGVECPRCDVILGSSRSLGGHITMMHSRNSCKTLKCPKCNWHYKYQETLDIHMKEKHPENEVQCVYCLTNQTHPRLARGEQYSCGYKPYRCEICKYSTTTKGNLSIHMQSDKHLNNVQELQQGKMPIDPSTFIHTPNTPGGGSQPHSVANMATASSISPSALLNNDSLDSANSNIPISATAGHSSPSGVVGSSRSPTSQQLGQQQQQQPKQTWRCDICNYETTVARNLRIHMTSEKHTQNALTMQQNMKQMQGFAQTDTITGGGSEFANFNGLQQLQMQLAAANFAAGGSTGVANDDMAHAAALFLQLQQNPMLMMKQFQSSMVGGQVGSDVTGNNSALFQCCICAKFAANDQEELLHHLQLDRSQPNETDVTLMAGNYMCNLCNYKTHLKANFQLHTKTDKHLQRLQLVNHIREGGAGNEWRTRSLAVNNTIQLRCNSCNEFSNSWQKLQLHVATLRHQFCAGAFLKVIATPLPSENHYFQCNLCVFGTKRLQSMIGHLNGPAHNEAIAHALRQWDGVQSLNAQDLPSADWLTIEETMADIDSPLDTIQTDECMSDSALRIDEEEPTLADSDCLANSSNHHHHHDELLAMTNDAVYCCNQCHFTADSHDQLQIHMNSEHATGSPKSSKSPVKSNTPSGNMSAYCCPLCQADCGNERAILEKHLSAIHSVSQEGIKHLLDMMPQSKSSPSATDQSASTHSPDSDDTSLVNHIPIGGRGGFSASSLSTTSSVFNCIVCSVQFTMLNDLFKHQNDSGHLEVIQTPSGSSYVCWNRGCNQTFSSRQEVQRHFEVAHGTKSPLKPGSASLCPESQTLIGGTVSDRHAYKFRCTQCSLAFKTAEKFQQHSQYHQMRNATKCAICGRNFRSIDGLKKHVETTHANLSAVSLQEYRAKIMQTDTSGQLDELNPGQSDSDDQDSEQNTTTTAQREYSNPKRQNFRCDRCKMAFTKQYFLTLHNKSILHRRPVESKTAINMEKYLDPSRPHKCLVCKESFTQKNILLVHYNSVAHLNMLRQQQNNGNGSINNNISDAEDGKLNGSVSKRVNGTDSSPSTIADLQLTHSIVQGSAKPYRCNVCRVQYSQRSTLDIHMRSVAHQSKMSKLHELTTNGDIDPNLPLVETPELQQRVVNSKLKSNPTSAPQQQQPTSSQNATTLAQQQQQQQQQQQFMASLLGMANLANMASFAPFLSMAAAGGGGMGGGFPAAMMGMTTPGMSVCEKCYAVFNNKDQLTSHKKTCCPQMMARPTTNEIMTSTPESKPVLSNVQEIVHSQTNGSNGSGGAHRGSLNGATCRRLLEEYGYEMVMQYNEQAAHRRKRSKSVDPSQMDTDTKKIKLESTTTAADEKGNENRKEAEKPPEMSSKYICQHCEKSFSGVWVLKAHTEQVHGEVVPFDQIEKLSEEVRQAYDQQLAPKSHTAPPAFENDANDQLNSAPDNCVVKQEVDDTLLVKVEPCDVPDSDSPLRSRNTPASSSSVGFSKMANYQQSAFPSLATTGTDDVNASLAQNMAALNAMAAMPFQAAALMGLPFGPFGFSNTFLPMMPGIPGLSGSTTESAMLAALSAATSSTAGLITTSALATSPAVSTAWAPMTSSGISPTVACHTSSKPSISSMNSGIAAAVQQAAVAQQQAAAAAAAQAAQQQPKRARTRITDDQLKVLRQYFDINNSPTDEMVEKMAFESGLQPKVIKHWFRNTLFKERQRNKDSPYNFSVPPSLSIDLEQYERTGETRVIALNATGEQQIVEAAACASRALATAQAEASNSEIRSEIPSGNEWTGSAAETTEIDDDSSNEAESSVAGPVQSKVESSEMTDMPSQSRDLYHQLMIGCINKEPMTEILIKPSEIPEAKEHFNRLNATENIHQQMSQSAAAAAAQVAVQTAASMAALKAAENLKRIGVLTGLTGSLNNTSILTSTPANNINSIMHQQISPASSSGSAGGESLNSFLTSSVSPGLPATSYTTSMNTMNASALPIGTVASPPGRRANRTRFTDDQIRVLQDFFERNAYPKDDDLEALSKRLGLSPRVIVVWFQNARQKARKLYENQPQVSIKTGPSTPAPLEVVTTTSNNSQSFTQIQQDQQNEDRIMRTPGQNYQCKKCDLVFQRYYELIKHQQNVCYKDEEKRNVSGISIRPPNISTGLEATDPLTCTQCQIVFGGQQQLMEHLKVHASNPALFTNGNKQRNQQQQQQPDSLVASFGNRSGSITVVCPLCAVSFESPNKLETHLIEHHQFDQSTIDHDDSDEFDEQIEQMHVNEEPDESVNVQTINPELVNWLKRSSSNGDALDLTKPIKVATSECNTSMMYDSGEYTSTVDDTHSQAGSDNSYMMEGDECASMDASSPGPHGSHHNSYSRSQKRFRTHLSSMQIRIMRTLFQDYKTPSMNECEMLGSEVGLHKRVVQVWFQNARAKERKAKAGESSSGSSKSLDSLRAGQTQCHLCGIVYNLRVAMQDHIFSKQHIDRIKAHLRQFEGMADSTGSSRGMASIPATAIEQVTVGSPPLADHPIAKRSNSQKSLPNTNESIDQSANAALQNYAYYASMMGLSGALTGLPASALFDFNVQGTPVSLLQVPESVQNEITSGIVDVNKSNCRFTQDAYSIEQFRSELSPHDQKYLVGLDQEVGWACRQCCTVFPQEQMYNNHVITICQCKKKSFTLVQTHYRCLVCQVQFGTRVEFQTHCLSNEHAEQC